MDSDRGRTSEIELYKRDDGTSRYPTLRYYLPPRLNDSRGSRVECRIAEWPACSRCTVGFAFASSLLPKLKVRID
jgi:hypothetical protein